MAGLLNKSKIRLVEQTFTFKIIPNDVHNTWNYENRNRFYVIYPLYFTFSQLKGIEVARLRSWFDAVHACVHSVTPKRILRVKMGRAKT